MEQINAHKRWMTWALIGVQLVIVILAMALGFYGYRYYQQRQGELSLLRQAKEILVKHAIQEVPSEQELEYGMIQGMLATMNDPYTLFVPPAQHEILTNELTGEFGGIGARLERDTLSNWRLYPIPGSSAAEAGVEDGDLLLKVDDLEVSPQTDDVTLLAALRGPVGEPVTLQILRNDEALDFTIKRQSIDLPSVSFHLQPEDKRIGFIKLNRIAESSQDELDQAILALEAQGASALILDLRDNGGGLVEAGLDIVSLFLSEGEIIKRQYKDQEIQNFSVKKPGAHANIPLVVLINQNTASSAEIVAGALKNHGRATLIGVPTYGKTQIQFIFDLQDGSSVHITSGQWWIPGLTFPLSPDIEVSDPSNEAEILKLALKSLAGSLK